MIKISELIERLKEFREKQGGRADDVSLGLFVEYIDQEQSKNKKTGVVRLEDREVARHIKEIRSNQENNKPFDPDEDYNNL